MYADSSQMLDIAPKRLTGMGPIRVITKQSHHGGCVDVARPLRKHRAGARPAHRAAPHRAVGSPTVRLGKVESTARSIPPTLLRSIRFDLWRKAVPVRLDRVHIADAESPLDPFDGPVMAGGL